MLSLHLQEELGWHRLHQLNKVFAKKELACHEIWTGTHHPLGVRSVCIIDWHCDRSFLERPPCLFEALSPRWQFKIVPCISKQQIQFSVVEWCKLDNQDPNKQVTMRHMEVVQKVMLDVSPATQKVVSVLILCHSI